ncbi:MAG TPA: 2-succinyl-6-hydroxy-2,4-cyclohexadiene-1-carboxylate synthase [Chloroflexota bacterium]|nr:2-succinyl-6-hydroxy-2,4-cyclohexadiene-1-carboxylate synthase [Chloroflexota bacterium]
MPELFVDGVTYYFEVHGGGRPLLLLHGFTGSSQNWQPVLAGLVTHYQVILVDVLGHGRTASPPDETRYAIDRVAADLIALMDECGYEAVDLLGYSMGGRLALATAVTYPHRVSRLILESASPGLATAAERQARVVQDRELADWIEANGIEAFVNRWEQLSLWDSQKQLPPEIRQELRQQRLQNNPVGLANSLRGMGAGAQPSLWEQLPGLTIPTLLLAGELDTKFEAINRQMAALLPNAHLEIVLGAGHTVHWERPLAWQGAVIRNP